jgi:hypothetical protein
LWCGTFDHTVTKVTFTNVRHLTVDQKEEEKWKD